MEKKILLSSPTPRPTSPPVFMPRWKCACKTLLDNLKHNRPFTSSGSKRVQARNHSYENVLSLHVYFHANQTHFHKNGVARRLVLRQRQRTTRKWPILLLSAVEIQFIIVGYYGDYTEVCDVEFISVHRALIVIGLLNCPIFGSEGKKKINTWCSSTSHIRVPCNIYYQWVKHIEINNIFTLLTYLVYF